MSRAIAQLLIAVFCLGAVTTALGQLPESEIHDYWTGSWQHQTRYVFTYDDQDRLITELEQFWQGMPINDWSDQYRRTYTYGAGPIPSEIFEEHYSGGTWIYSALTEYEPNGLGDQVSIIHSTWSGFDWVPEWRVVHAYDGLGQLIRHTEYEPGEEKDEWIPVTEAKITWVLGDSTEVVYFTYNGATFDTTSRLELGYSKHNMVETEFFEYDAGSWEPVTLTRYEYNEYEDLDIVATLGWDGAAYVRTFLATYKYDDKQQLLQVLNQMDVLDVLENLSRVVYDYDSPTPVEPSRTTVLPERFCTAQSYPNPFNPRTTIEFDLPRAGHVSVEVFDMLGRRVDLLLDQRLSAGRHTIEWNAADRASGVYFYRVSVPGGAETKKMILLR